MKICNGRRTGNDKAVYTNIFKINVDKLVGTLPLLILFINYINSMYRNMYEERK